MNLLLWRHAEANEPEPGQSDLDRTLTPRGIKQARRVAHWLHQHGPQPQNLRILVSPATRCQQTAQALALPHDIDKRLAPDATVSDLLTSAQWHKNKAREANILLVGHQPTLGHLAAWLLSGEEADWAIKKGALWWFSTGRREEIPHAFLRTVIDPGFL